MSAKKKRRPKVCMGSRPPTHEHPQLLATVSGLLSPTGGDEHWELWLRAARSTTGEWLNLKLCAAPAPGKPAGVVLGQANFWLGWDVKGSRFAVRKDYGRVRAKRPELLATISEVLSHIGDYMGDYVLRDGYAPRGCFQLVIPSVSLRGNGEAPPRRSRQRR